MVSDTLKRNIRGIPWAYEKASKIKKAKQRIFETMKEKGQKFE